MDPKLNALEDFMRVFHDMRRVRLFNRGLAARMGYCVAVSAVSFCFPATAFTDSEAAVPWSKLPRMELERQFAGPLQDTIIQRWRDPADGTACYVYLPITAQHSSPTESGYVQYGANIIGTISCVAGKASEKSVEKSAGKKKAAGGPNAASSK
jgi:hypothetical protein